MRRYGYDMILALLSLALPPAPQVPERVEAPPPSIAASTGGVVRDGSRLEVDRDALFEESAPEPQLAGREPAVDKVIEDLIAQVRDVLERHRPSVGPAAPPAAEPHPDRPDA